MRCARVLSSSWVSGDVALCAGAAQEHVVELGELAAEESQGGSGL